MIRLDLDAQVLAMADALNAKIAGCHEVVACPRCNAPVGVRCVRVLRAPRAARRFVPGAALKHPHRERWTLVVQER